MINNRLSNLRRKMAQENLGGIIISDRTNVFYLSGFSGSEGDLLITLDAAYIICDFRYLQQAAEQCPLYTIRDIKEGIYNIINDIIIKHGIARLGIEDRVVSSAVYSAMKRNIKGAELVGTAGLVAALKIIKDDTEIANLTKAAELAVGAFHNVLDKIRPGVAECEIAAELEYYMRKNGASGTSFETVVASGANSAKPHGTASEKKIEIGDFVVMDFGCLYNGYCSDITRTVAVGGITKEQQRVYNAVHFTQLKMLSLVAPGKVCSEIDGISRNLLDMFGYKEFFGHSLGHGVGTEVHELPTLGPRGTDTLKPGMIVTVEPGVYFDSCFGVRIEDTVLVTENGVKILCEAPKELIIL